jgi:hypothetical protein
MADPDGDGYANIEEYVNNTGPWGGKTPLVCVSASCPRAWAGDEHPGAFRFWRNGPAEGELAVSYSVSDAARPGQGRAQGKEGRQTQGPRHAPPPINSRRS